MERRGPRLERCRPNRGPRRPTGGASQTQERAGARGPGTAREHSVLSACGFSRPFTAFSLTKSPGDRVLASFPGLAARSSLSPTFLVSWGSVLTGPRSPSLSSHVTGARWGLGTQDTAVLTEHECLWTAFPRCGEFKPSFIPSEQRSAANEKAVAFRNAPTVLSTSCKFFLNSHNKAMRWILCPC